jgi:hypothetical protein
MANDREIAVASRLHRDDAEPVLGVLVGDALDSPASTSLLDGRGSVLMTPIVSVSSRARP